jgi:hypothetical protein
MGLFDGFLVVSGSSSSIKNPFKVVQGRVAISEAFVDNFGNLKR